MRRSRPDHPDTVRRRLVAASLAAPLWVPAAARAQADTYPNKPLRFIVPLGPGSGADSTTRFLAERASAILGQPAIAENRPGADMLIAVQSLLSAPPDGHSILMLSPSSVVINPVLQKDLPYDAQKDIRPLATITRSFAVFVTRPDGPLTSMKDVVDAARARPGQVSLSNYGHHYRLGAISLERPLNVRFNHVVYKGAAQAINDVIGGTIDVALTDMTGALPLIDSGKLRALAVTGRARHPRLPNVPTVAETVLPDYDLYVWIGFGVHGKTPEPIARKLEAALVQAIRSPEYAKYNAEQGASEIVGSGGDQLAALIASETERYRTLVRQIEADPK